MKEDLMGKAVHQQIEEEIVQEKTKVRAFLDECGEDAHKRVIMVCLECKDAFFAENRFHHFHSYECLKKYFSRYIDEHGALPNEQMRLPFRYAFRAFLEVLHENKEPLRWDYTRKRLTKFGVGKKLAYILREHLMKKKLISKTFPLYLTKKGMKAYVDSAKRSV